MNTINVQDVRKIVMESIMESIYLDISAESFSDDMRLVENLGFDSIIYIQVVVTVEEKLGFEMSDDVLMMADIATFGELYRVIEKSVVSQIENKNENEKS